jgi:phospho-N-acetylmuramoyl-pentapeptide-transferase
VIPILVAGAVGLAITLLGTPVAIRLFRDWGWGQRIREDGPHTHFEKVGTPTMGGIVMVGALIVAYLATRFTVAAGFTFSPAGLALVLATAGFALVGFVDDFLKIRRQRSLGLSKAQKFIGTAIVSILFAVIVDAYSATTGTSTSLSFLRPSALELGIFFFLWVFVVLTSSSNAVNLTDGLDGLAIGPVIMAGAAFGVIAYLTGNFRAADYLKILNVRGAGELAVFCGALIGAAVGFLWFNCHPAEIFMGDAGSLALGGAIGTLAVLTKAELLLPLIGGLYVVEAVSVIIQVASFKLTGRRVFRMAPLHHHYELSGWPEPKIVVRFWIVSFALALLALTTLKLR